LQFVDVYTVVMVLQSLCSDAWRATLLLLLLYVVRHGRAAATEPKRKVKRVAKDATEPAPERNVDDEVCRRIDDKKQLADNVESHKMT